MKLNCVIVDDEYLAINVLKEYSSRLDLLNVVETFTQPKEALGYLKQNKIQLLFLDIQMPGLNGFELLQQLTEPPMVIFTTARHDYAARAFELDVVDYLVKPIAPDRFEKAVAKAQNYFEWRSNKFNRPKDFIMVQSDYHMVKVPIHDILYLEGFGEYVKIFTADKMIITLMTLKKLHEQLPAHQFLRVHKSYIVATTSIVAYNHQRVKLANQKELPLGRMYKADFMKYMRE